MEGKYPGLGVIVLEGLEEGRNGAPEAIDGLVRIADEEEVSALRT